MEADAGKAYWSDVYVLPFVPTWQMLRVGKAKADVWPKTAPKKGESWAGKGKLGPTPFNKKEI